MEQAGLEILRNSAEEQYEARRQGHLAVLTYADDGAVLSLLHTEVPPELEGQGVSGALVRAALEDARSRGLRVVAFCPFARSWLARHPEYADLVREEED
jgi:predicted GNAT family acetyltransferase